MTSAYVLMTAMPPTKGHLQLIQFAEALGTAAVNVLVTTQPGEPFEYERVEALRAATQGLNNVVIHHLRRQLPQEPEEATGFWDMWAEFLTLYGLGHDDVIVASENYGLKLAEVTGAKYVPYDTSRFINPLRATVARNDTLAAFDSILPEFQQNLRLKVTIFGAESCGKTTLTRGLGSLMNAWTLPEWARTYLEGINDTTLNTDVMTTIWDGQNALQKSAERLYDRPFLIQDTDLFSTIGYWALHADEYGEVPEGLIAEAKMNKSDLYIFCPSNIPFKEDPLRYGGHEREANDDYWLEICDEFDLPYVRLANTAEGARLIEAKDLIKARFEKKARKLEYARRGEGHEAPALPSPAQLISGTPFSDVVDRWIESFQRRR